MLNEVGMPKLERAIVSLQKIADELQLIAEDLEDDGFEEYADILQGALTKLATILYVLKHEENTGDKT
jgi:hypothetical protein